jgi:serine/threonine protein kinase
MAVSPEAATEQPIDIQLDLSNFDSITAAPLRSRESMCRFFYAINRLDKAPVTLMVISSSDSSDTSGGFRARFIRELAHLRSLRHPHIVRIASMRIEEPCSAPSLIVFEGQHSKLGAYLEPNVPLPTHQVRQFMKSLLSALALLHSRELLHQYDHVLIVFCAFDT